MAIEWGGLGHIVGGDDLFRTSEEHVGRELAAYNGDIRRKVHPQHTQHAFLLLLCIFFFVSLSNRHSSVTLSTPIEHGDRRDKFGSFLGTTTRAAEGGTVADPPFTRPEYPPALPEP